MADSSNSNGNFGDSGVIEFTGKVMVVVIILLFFIVVFVFSIHIYTKWFWRRRIENTQTTTTRRRRRLDFAAGHYEITIVPALRHGLDASILKTLPLTVFDPKDFKDGLECAVCLSEISEGEKIRVLPKCNHGFHLECIDMWFQSHSTCPLCRNPVANPNQSNIHSGESALENMLHDNSNEAPNFPTNVLFWGDETHVSAFDPCVEETRQGSSNAISEPLSSSSASTSNRASGILMIDIPREVNEDQEEKSLVSTRFRSLRRLFSGTSRVNPFSTRILDIEQGGSGQT